MKIYFKIFLTLLIISIVGAVPMSAQFDDLYYDPDTDELYTAVDEDDYYEDDYYDEAYADGYEDGYDEAYDDEYSYATRINRFRRNSYNIDYFSPVFMVGGWNSPFIFGGYSGIASIDYYNWRRWNRWNRFSYGYNGLWGSNVFCDNFGWNSGFYYSPFNSPFYRGAFFSGNYWGNSYYGRGFNRWGGAYGQNQVVLANGNVNRYYRTTESNGRYYGSRNTTGTVVSRNSNLNSPRVTSDRSRVKTRVTETTRGSDNRIASRRKADVTTRRTTKVRNSGIVSNNGNVTGRTSRVSQSRRSGNTISNRSNSSRINSTNRTATRTRINTNRSSSQRSSINRSTRTTSRPSMNTNRTSNTRSSVNRTTSSRSGSSTRSSSRSSSRRGG